MTIPEFLTNLATNGVTPDEALDHQKRGLLTLPRGMDPRTLRFRMAFEELAANHKVDLDGLAPVLGFHDPAKVSKNGESE